MASAKNALRLLLVFVPVSVYLAWTHASPAAIFVTSCLAVLPLAGLMGEATENLAHHTGPRLGGLISSSFGNAAELILAFMALRGGQLEIVQASLTGSILGNLLVVLGLAMLCGGWRRDEQVFNRMAAESGASMMFLAVVALVIPAIYGHVTEHRFPGHLESISLDISWILIGTYAGSLVFSLKSHRHLFVAEGDDAAMELEDGHCWSVRRSALVLAGAAVGVAIVAEQLVHAVEAAGAALGLRPVFMGVVVLAVIGNAAENSTAVLMAVRGKMDMAVGIAIGSSMQIAIFVAPLLVIAGHFLGTPLSLEFTILEVVAVMLAVGAVTLLVHDGRTNWFEGLQLLAIYAILAVAFYYI